MFCKEMSACLLLLNSENFHSQELLCFVHNGYYSLRSSIAIAETEMTPISVSLPVKNTKSCFRSVLKCSEQLDPFRSCAVTCGESLKRTSGKKIGVVHPMPQNTDIPGELVDEEDLREVNPCRCICKYKHSVMYSHLLTHLKGARWGSASAHRQPVPGQGDTV